MLSLENIIGPQITGIPGKDALIVAIAGGSRDHNPILTRIVAMLREYGYTSTDVVKKENGIGVMFERTDSINLTIFDLPPHLRNRELKR